METTKCPARVENEDDTDIEEDEPPHVVHHVRTASVILESGDRVRKKVSLLSVYDEPLDESLERTPLLNSGETAGVCYSSIAPGFVDRSAQPLEWTWYENFRSWPRSEGLKRSNIKVLILIVEC